MRDARERLLHMLEAIERIEKYASRGEEAFRADELIQNWVVRHLQVLGEAARALAPEFRGRYTDVPWTYIIGMRHVLVHEYFGIDLDIVWRVVSEDPPILKLQLHAVVTDQGCNAPQPQADAFAAAVDRACASTRHTDLTLHLALGLPTRLTVPAC